MNTKNHNSKYRLLVLMDLSKASEAALKNAVQLAKVIKGDVRVLHVKAPADVVTFENQFSAMRAIQEDSRNTQTKLKEVIHSIEKKERIFIPFKIAYGNIKHAIKEEISKINPNIILFGKQKLKLNNLFNTNITSFLVKECSTNVLIVGEDHKFHSYSDISLGMYGEAIEQEGIEIINDLNQKNSNPIRFFSIRSKKNVEKDTSKQKNTDKRVSYVFSEGSNALDGIVSYISRTNMQLFCISRKYKVKTSLQQLVDKLDIPVLILK